MKCPIDQTTLAITERSGIEIDYCPECRGVWLDRGELDKVLDRAATIAAPVAQASFAGAASGAAASGAGAGAAGMGSPAADQARYDREHEAWQHGYDRRGDDRPHGDDRRRPDSSGARRRPKKDSWLSELFD